jgi:nicotinate-nucleotide adenylyltransferase
VIRDRIGIFGGTFDPIHVGHLVIATECLHVLGLQRVAFVPSASPPHKPNQFLSAPTDRLAMLKLAIHERPQLFVDSIEFERPGPSFTVDTLRELRRRDPESDFVFIMGADSLRELHLWRDPGGIVAQAELAVARRPGVAIDLAEVNRRVPGAAERVNVVDVPLIGVSSSDIRRRVVAGEPISFQMPWKVEMYIRERKLYCSV